MWAGEWESPAPNDAKDFRLSLVLNEQHSPPFRLALLPCFMSRTGIDASEFRKRLSSATSKRKERAITLKKKKNDLISILYVRTLLSALTVVQNPLQRHFFRIGFRPTFFFFLAFALGVLGWLQISCAVQSAGKRAAASAVPYFVPIVFSCYEEEDPLPDICFSFVREKKKKHENNKIKGSNSVASFNKKQPTTYLLLNFTFSPLSIRRRISKLFFSFFL